MTLAIFLEWNMQMWSKSSQGLLKKAQSGDLAYAKLVLSYVVGQPSPFESPDQAIRTDVIQQHFNSAWE